jgi:hypothetical protein
MSLVCPREYMSDNDHTGSRLRTDGGIGRWISFGVATYLVLGLGTAVSVYLLGMLGSALSSGPGGVLPGTGGMLTGNALSGAILVGLLVVAFFGAAVATGIGIFAGRNSRGGESAATNGALSSGVGVLVTAVVMVVLLVLLGSGSGTGSGGGDLLGLFGMVIGLTVGVGITGAVAAGVGERSATW